MAKRPLPSSAFALPGLSKPDTKKPFGISYTRSTGHSKNLSTKNENGPVEDNFNSSLSLVDDKGSLLPVQTKHTLDNLTKTRPRNPGRRSPSPLARRKFEQDSLGSESVHLSKPSLEAGNSKKSNYQRNISNDRLNAVKERTAFSPALMITNDVGFSISSDELSVSRTSPRTSPRIRNRHQVDRPEILPKPNRNLNRMNADHVPEESDFVGNITDLTHDSKISEEHNNPATMEPPPLPSSPPPLEDDVSASDPNETLRRDAKHSMQGSSFGKVIETVNGKSLNSNPSRTLGSPIDNSDEVNGFSRTKQGRATTSSDISSSSSRIGKWQGYGRTWSGENHASTGMAQVGVALSERQTSLDSAIASRLSKYDTPYSSRQRKSVDKSPSSRRRRFKPVSLVDESEMTNTASTDETQSTDSLSKVDENRSQPISERFHGVQAGKFLPGQAFPRHLTNGTEIQTDGLSLSGSNTKNRFQRNEFAPEKKVQPVTSSSLLASKHSAGQSNEENSRQHPSLSDKFALNRTSPEPTVLLEYDVRNSEEKVIEVETNETAPFVVSDRSGMYSSKADYLKKELSKDSRAVIDTGLNDRPDMQEGSPQVTLPKVVIEYDGEVVRDSMLHGYDTENSSDEANLSKSSFEAEQDTFNLQQKEQESDGSSPVENGGDLQYSDYSDEEEDLDLVLDDVSLDDEDLTFEDLDSARQKMKQGKGMFFVFIRLCYRSSSD